MSNSLSIEFVKPSQELQLELITKELKGKDLPNVEKYGHKLDLKPIYTEAGKSIQLSSTLDYRINFQMFGISGDTAQVNKDILNALNNGVNGIILNTENQSIGKDELNVFLKRINLNYINIVFENVAVSSIQGIESYLQEHFSDIDKSNICINTQEKHQYSEHILVKEEDFFTQCKEVFNIIDTIASDKDIYINIELNNDFYWNIAKVRALKILLDNYSKLEQRTGKLIYTGYSQLDYESEIQYPERNILKLTLTSLSALIATCDGVYNVPFLAENNSFSRRISKNIFNILDEESFINKVKDISSGSYYIERYTQEIAKIIHNTIGK